MLLINRANRHFGKGHVCPEMDSAKCSSFRTKSKGWVSEVVGRELGAF